MKVWNFESIENHIKENYKNITLLKLEVKRINNKNKKYITITNGAREREMCLTNFLKSGCDFHEKTDKRINEEDICNKIKSIYTVDFIFKNLEFTDNTFNTYNRIKIFINDCYEVLSKMTGEDYNERKIHIC